MNVVVTGPPDEDLLLDLLNTTPIVDGIPCDELDAKATARTWLREHGVPAAELSGLLDVRPILQAVVRGERSAAALGPSLAAVTVHPSATAAGVDWHVDGACAAVRAVLAWDALRINSPGRLRPCANTECRLFLIDRSKPNTARWCSMAICGNRMKARRHYRRIRSEVNPG